MTVYKNDGQYDASNVKYRNGEILAYDKTPGISGMNYIDWGLGVMVNAITEGAQATISSAASRGRRVFQPFAAVSCPPLLLVAHVSPGRM